MVTLTDCTFAWLRRDFARQFNLDERLIRPETPLSQVLPPAKRTHLWRSGQRRLGLDLPTLELPPALARTGWLLSLGSGGRAGLVALVLGGQWIALPVALAGLVGFAALFRVLSAPWRTELPGIETFGDLSRAVLARNLRCCRQLFGLEPTRDEIFAVVARILVDFGAERKRITPEARLVDLLEC